MFYKDERLLICIDDSTTFPAAKALGFTIDYKLLREEFMRRGKVLRLMCYTVLLETEDQVQTRARTDFLEYNGYKSIRKPVKEYLDLELAVDAMELSSKIDHLVIFSGNGGFQPLVKSVQRQGVRVSIVSTIRKRSFIADDLRRQADNFIDLNDLREVIGSAPRQSTVCE